MAVSAEHHYVVEGCVQGLGPELFRPFGERVLMVALCIVLPEHAVMLAKVEVAHLAGVVP